MGKETYTSSLTEEQIKDLAENHYQVVEIITDRMLASTPYKSYKPYREDLLGEATIALMKSAQRYDPSRGVKFVTYCSQRIRGDLRKYIERKLVPYLAHHWDIDSMVLEEIPIEEQEDTSESKEIDWTKYEPEGDVKKSIFYRVLLGGENQKEVAKELGIGYTTLKRFRKQIIEDLKDNINSREEM